MEPVRTFLVPYLLFKGAKNKIETTPLATPNPAMQMPMSEGDIPSPPFAMGVLRKTGWRITYAMSMSARRA